MQTTISRLVQSIKPLVTKCAAFYHNPMQSLEVIPLPTDMVEENHERFKT